LIHAHGNAQAGSNLSRRGQMPLPASLAAFARRMKCVP